MYKYIKTKFNSCTHPGELFPEDIFPGNCSNKIFEVEWLKICYIFKTFLLKSSC